MYSFTPGLAGVFLRGLCSRDVVICVVWTASSSRAGLVSILTPDNYLHVSAANIAPILTFQGKKENSIRHRAKVLQCQSARLQYQDLCWLTYNKLTNIQV